MKQNTAAPTFHKIESGLYGTGIYETKNPARYFHCHKCSDKEYDGAEITVEWCIDRYTSTQSGWDLRKVCEHGVFMEELGGWYPTLREAKAAIVSGSW
jgi:hypothetical protein